MKQTPMTSCGGGEERKRGKRRGSDEKQGWTRPAGSGGKLLGARAWFPAAWPACKPAAPPQPLPCPAAPHLQRPAPGGLVVGGPRGAQQGRAGDGRHSRGGHGAHGGQAQLQRAPAGRAKVVEQGVEDHGDGLPGAQAEEAHLRGGGRGRQGGAGEPLSQQPQQLAADSRRQRRLPWPGAQCCQLHTKASRTHATKTHQDVGQPAVEEEEEQQQHGGGEDDKAHRRASADGDRRHLLLSGALQSM